MADRRWDLTGVALWFQGAGYALVISHDGGAWEPIGVILIFAATAVYMKLAYPTWRAALRGSTMFPVALVVVLAYIASLVIR